ncbi:2-amino-4-hydroxy-6-hydroxymethyldihydropteridine diphosphokinase [Ferruginibacter sp. SUN106]|uniref:2-amino-4-hydroxy-6- hydroxymethyldihydropteridine diphosphokinase n=1 Tax=Ferruginibacter sp. SUN106 TaxID=2978348 RepID=UPI003D36C56D
MNIIYLLLGSNQNNPHRQLAKACSSITKQIGNIKRVSGIYQTAAWGNTQQPDFLNQVIIVDTPLNAEAAMQTILAIEEKMGRVRTKKNAPRIIDIDILFFNKEIIETKNLSVPHPQLQNRNFVLIPLNELSPNLKHPVLNKTIHQLLRISPDTLTVNKI